MTQAAVSGRALSTGIATAVLLMALAGAAQAQQAYYFPQAGNGPVTINYGALTPYAAPGYQPYGAAPYGAQASQPRSVFTPQAVAPAYGVPSYTPVYAAPSSQFLPGQVTSVPTGQPATLNPITYNAPVAQPPFIAPYGNPAYAAQMAAQMQGGMNGLPSSTPQSYLNVPGQAPVALMGVPQPGAKPFDPNNLQPKKTRKASAAASTESTAVEEAAAAQVAAVEAQLESGPAPSAPLPEPTPPEAPAEIPANVPSPADSADVAAAAAPVAPAAAATSVAETVPADAATIEPPAEGAADTQTAAVEPAAEAAPAEEAAAEEEVPADTGGAAALPAGGTRIVFEPGADELPAGAGGDLDELAQKMMGDETIKVQVLAYSSATGDNESQARRKALSRGLEVRKYLIGKGVRSNRIDVRALGSKSEGSPADRVDIVPAAG